MYTLKSYAIYSSNAFLMLLRYLLKISMVLNKKKRNNHKY